VEKPISEARPALQRKQSEVLLDLLRCIAATLVLLYHWRECLFRDYPTLTAPSLPLKVFYFVTGLGPPAVMIFFVLSGYLVFGSALRARRAGTWTIASYLNQRVTRLIVPLLPALLLCWLVDAIGLRLHPQSFFYNSLWTETVNSPVALRHSPALLLQNLLFLQDVKVPIYGSDGPLWSLSYEFWYYIFLVPVFAASISRRPRTIVLSAAFLIAAMYFAGPDISKYALIWLLGASVVFAVHIPLRLSKSANRALIVASVLLLLLTLAMVRFKSIHSYFLGDFLLGLACALFIGSAARSSETVSSNFLTRGAKSYAGWTYSLYLLHMPVLVLIASLLVRAERWTPDALHFALAAGILIAVLLYANAVSLFTERRTDWVRAFVAAKLNLNRPTSKPPLESSTV
jgi:peptidoglycan/LPS O-acetylase OafA/YrhL